MPYSAIASIAAAALVIHFLLAVDASHRAKALVVAVLFVGLLVPLFIPRIAVVGLLLQVGLAIFLLMHARYRG
jgi:hypothetical protein